ncbi:MAG TPA: hydrogenase maturation nickel metallochaperone HypA [Polyangiales bacterium]|nr:hydrogenase maturation nickel metallochaperone HypA [Polyangiales bacterium]
MHELSLAADILSMIEAAAERERFARVASLELEAGVLAGVDVPALRFALEAMAPGTLLEGAAVHIARPEGRALCPACAREVPLAALGDACPSCGSYGLRPTAGTQLRVLRLTVHDRSQ